jgi:hypothetical protein
LGLVVYCRLWLAGQEPIFKWPANSWEMKMNWLFEAYSNVYNTAMGQRSFHHKPGSLVVEQAQRLKRVNCKNDV